METTSNITPTTIFDQTVANDVTALLNAYTQYGDFEARDALLTLLETHGDDESLATTISSALEYHSVWSNQQ